jgi:hypothetical protein
MWTKAPTFCQLLYPRLAPGGELHGRVGIVMADFPGPGLISAVIACNPKSM